MTAGHVIPPSPGYVWWLLTSSRTRHQFLIDAKPDDKGALKAKCTQLAMDDRVDREDPSGELCPNCLICVGHAVADRLEALSLATNVGDLFDVALTPEELDEQERRNSQA